MAVEKQIAIITLNAYDLELAKKIKAIFPKAKIHHLSDSVGAQIQKFFNNGTTIIGVMATGALIRILAPHLKDKHSEPPVIAVSADGASVVPLLGGHHGANAMAKTIATGLSAHAAITTAGDVRFNVGLDEPPKGYVLKNIENAKSIMAQLLKGEEIKLSNRAKWLNNSDLPINDDAKLEVMVSEEAQIPNQNQLLFHPKTLVLGMGCERGASSDEVIGLAEKTLRDAGLARESIAFIGSIDLKADEVALHEAAQHFNVPVRFFDADELNAQREKLKNPSEIVFLEVGVYGVAEGAALTACDELLVEKQKSKRATCAIGRAEMPLDAEEFGRNQGHVSIVGLGPGDTRWRSNEAGVLVAQATDLVGYSLYLDLLEDEADGKIRHDFDLGKEEDRVRHALELAGEGKNVALICSGDPGIYAMATLAFELLEHGNLSDAAERVSIQVSPGISALQGAAARAGAPLGHDFCTISLSDLLTPWAAIQRRIKAASEGDFVIAFYNPVSKRRRTQLAHAKEVLLQHRPADTPVILATNLGREGEKVRFVELQNLIVDEVDMLTVVVVGSSESRKMKQKGGKEWVYTPRGYSDKSTTQMTQLSDGEKQ